MSISGKCLADQVLDYLRFRAGTGEVRLLLSGYPSAVLEDACREIIRDTQASGDPDRLQVEGKGSVEGFDLAFIQDDADIALKGPLSSEGYSFGCTWSHQVGVRNQLTTSVIAVPPTLAHIVGETLTANTAQVFVQNQRFGAPARLMRSIAERIAANEPDAWSDPSLLARALQTTRSFYVRYGGEAADERFFDSLDEFAQQSAAPDFRLLGLLPDTRLRKWLSTGGARIEQVEHQTNRNLQWQLDLVAGLGGRQHKYLAETFGESERYRSLLSYLVSCDLRLEWSDQSWRREWPTDLPIDLLGVSSSRQRTKARITNFRAVGTSSILGVPIIIDPPQFKWRVGSARPQLQGALLVGGSAVVDLDLMPGEAALTDVLPPGQHVISLISREPETQLTGSTQMVVLVPDGSPGLLVSVDGLSAGQQRYAVPKGAEFVLNWEPIPGSPPFDSVAVTIAAASGEMRVLTEPGAFSVVVDGVQEVSEATVRAMLDGRSIPGMEETIRLEPWDQSETSERSKAASIARALLDAASRIGEPARERTGREVEVSGSGLDLDIRLLSSSDPGDPPTRGYTLGISELLHRFERQILDSSGSLWPRLVAWEREGRKRVWSLVDLPSTTTAPWFDGVDQEVLKTFMSARGALFARLSREEGGFASVELTTLVNEVQEYVAAYVSMLRPRVSDGERVDDVSVALALLDCVLVPRGLSGEQGAAAGLEDSFAAVLVPPTHPLRLAWLCQFETSVRELIKSNSPWSWTTLMSLDSCGYPACVMDWSFGHYHNAGILDGDRWGLLLHEDAESADEVLPADFVRDLGISSRLGGDAAGALDVAREIAHYHDLHPFKSSLRIGYLNPGTAEELREALSLLVGGGVRHSNQQAARNSADCRYVATLVAADGAAGVGSAFDDYAASADADPDFLDSIVFTRAFELSGSGGAKSPEHHVLFGTGVVEIKGRNIQLARHAVPPSFGGLLLRQRRSFESDPKSEVITHTLTTEPQSLSHEVPSDLPGLLHEGVYMMQSLAAASDESQFVSKSVGRGVVAAIPESATQEIDRMHDAAEWVCMMDSHVDVEYFDGPAAHDRYVIEYVPRFVVQNTTSNQSRSAAFVVTASPRHNVPIRAAINRFLNAAYGNGLDAAAESLASAVNRVSGRLLLQLVGQPAAAKGATGMGLAYLLYERAGLLGANVTAGGALEHLRMLLPVDDYAAHWIQTYREFVGTSSASHADLLDVDVWLEGDAVRLSLQVVEVKNHRRGHYPTALKSSAAEQVGATARVLRELLGIGGGQLRADAPIQAWELSELVDFHLRRTARQLWGDDLNLMKAADAFRLNVRRLIAAGAYSVHWSSNDAVGTVLHFNPDEEHFSTESRIERLQVPDPITGVPSSVGYVAISLPEIRSLLESPSVGGWVEGVGDLLSGSFGTEIQKKEQSVVLQPTPVVVPGATTGSAAEEGLQSPQMVQAQAAFQGMVGNAEAITRLSRYVAHALMESPHRLPVNLALTGPASTGKTTLSKRIAAALGLPYLLCQGQTLTTVDDLVAKMEAVVTESGGRLERIGERAGMPVLRFPPMVVFIDEAHELRPRLQEGMLTLLEPNDRYGMTSRVVVGVENVTFVLATTEWGDFAHTLQSRLREIKLRPYTADEVAKMVGGQHPDWPEDVLRRLAIAGRLVPRIALERADDLTMACRVEPGCELGSMLDTLFAEWGMDDEGVTEQDIRYLQSLMAQGGSAGLDRLQSLLNIGRNELTRVIEPYLVHKGLVRITGSGRELTPAGRNYVLRVDLVRRA